MSSIDTEQNTQSQVDSQEDEGDVDVILDEENVLSSDGSNIDAGDDRPVAASDSSEHEDYSEKVKKRIDKLTNRYHEAERRETAALDYARGLQETNKDLSSRINNLDKGYRSEFSTRIDSQITEAKARYKEAYDLVMLMR